MVLRYGVIVLAVIIALLNPESFTLWAVLAGYGALYLFVSVDMLLQLRKVR
ncbi:hypothetical protein JCM19055_162 [Geomicrobium sp. JCM 19055]|nr:hypothetical protein JCM19055_162 [Geomicrobium sp. JCM 19055]